MFGERVSDETIVEYLLSIPDQTLRYATENCAPESPYVFEMYGMYNDRFYDFSLNVDDLLRHMKMQLFSHEKNFYHYFRNKDLTILNFILSSDKIEYPQTIPMLETYDFDTSKALMGWAVSTNRTSETVLNMIGDEYDFFREIDAQDRIELKKHFWECAYKRNQSHASPFHCFPYGDHNIMLLCNLLPLHERYNALFGKERIESDGWTDEDVDVMVEFVKKYEISPYFIAHDLRGKKLYGRERVYQAALEAGENYLKYLKVKKSSSYINWKIPDDVFENRDFANFINKMKLKYGVEQ